MDDDDRAMDMCVSKTSTSLTQLSEPPVALLSPISLPGTPYSNANVSDP
jgi:hypothetical protein